MRIEGIARRLAIAAVALALAAPAHVGRAAAARSSRTSPASPSLRDSSIWTPTTYEAATAAAHKQALAGGKRTTVTGEVVDVSCYLQLGKRGAAHVECGSKCVANGQPLGIVDRQNRLYVLFPEEHHPRRDGDVDVKSKYVLLLAKQVKVTGTATMVGGTRALFVKADDFPDTLQTNRR